MTTAAYHRHDISDRAWKTLDPPLPGGPSKVGRPAQDNRRLVNVVFRALRTGEPWRDLPRIMDTGTRPTIVSAAGRKTAPGPNSWLLWLET